MLAFRPFLEPVEMVGGALRLGSRCKNRTLVGLEHGQPVRKIVSVVRQGFRGHTQISAQESGAHFRHQFFDGVSLIAKAFAELPRQGLAPLGS